MEEVLLEVGHQAVDVHQQEALAVEDHLQVDLAVEDPQ